jgi:tetratricopeptide (TPR) repeat protein
MSPYKKWTGLVCVLLAIGFLTDCGKSAAGYVERGNSLFNQGKFSEAELNYRKALQKDSGSADASYHLALAVLKQNKPQEAYQALLQALRLAPDHQGARTELTNLALPSYIVDPQHPKARYDLLLKYSMEWLQKDPRSLEGLRIKAYLAMEERRPEEAAQLFQRALEANPGNLKMTLGLIDALYRNNRAAEAEKAALNFLTRDPSAGDVYDALYRLYQTTNRPADAESILIRKAKNNPQKGEYMLELAGHYARFRKKPEMEATLQSFLSNPAREPDVHLRAGDFYSALGNWPAAVQQYQAGVSSDPKSAQRYNDRIARALLSQGKYDEGLKALNAAIALNADDEEAKSLRAAVLIGKGAHSNPGEGLEQFKKLVDKSPDDLFLKFVLSKAQMQVGDLAGAKIQLLDIVKRSPHFLDVQVALASIAYTQGNMTQAVQYAVSALEIEPNHPRALMIRGSGLMRLGNFEEAGSILTRVARQAPNSVDARLELAYLDLNRRRYADAGAAFQKILNTNPNEWRAIGGLVDVDLAQNRVDRVFGRLEQELKRTHGAPQIYRMMANAALETGKYGEAISNLQHLVDLSPNSIDPMLDLANAYRLKGEVRNAIAVLNKAAVLKPKDPRPANLLPFLLEMDNRRQEAKAQARRALTLQPEDLQAMNNLAFVLAETGDSLDEALKLARQAVVKAPEQPSFMDTLGFVYLKKGQDDEALDIFNRLNRKYPDDPTCGYHLGMALFQKGDRARAKLELSRALQKRPPHDLEIEINDLLHRIN